MTTRRDVVVIGAGHNGLVCAALLARVGLDVLVLERRDRPGGAADTAEIAPGFRAPVAAHTVGRFRRSLIRSLRLPSHGLRLVDPPARAYVPGPEGRSLTLWTDPARTAEELRAWSSADAEAYPRFDRKLRALASFVAYLHAMTPPDPTGPSMSDALGGLRLLRRLRRLGGPGNTREVLRVLPMAVADLVKDAFDTDPLRAAIASRGVQYTAMGPWSAGTAAVLLSDAVGGGGVVGQAEVAVGGPGALADAMLGAARSAGAEVRCGVEVRAVRTEGDRATGVVVGDGDEIAAGAVVSGADPKRTLLDLIDPAVLGPTMGWRASNIRSPGTVAKVNLALDALPPFGVEEERLQGRIVFASSIDELESAFDASKYGRVSDVPYLEATIPTLSDPGLAPDGGHVMSVVVQWAPYGLAEGTWDDRRDELGDLVLKRLEQRAPGLTGMVRERHVLTPLDLEREYGLTEGHPLTPSPASISSSPGGRCTASGATGCRSSGCTSAARGPTREAASPGHPVPTRRGRSPPT
ncbi:MAG TPA: NAD(P)/FAD-dependent oxidoreductase [Actinomycetota bacterium]|nr:NAD(P)/FAD-dependent oxidoreductase [Actinomycetota bacterium]